MEEREFNPGDNPVEEPVDEHGHETGEGAAAIDGDDGCLTGDAVDHAPEEDDREKLLAMLEQEKSRAEENYNRMVRIQADFDNYRKRVAREREELLKYASEHLITGLLPVLDNFDRALAVKYDDAEKLLAGVEMIKRQLDEVLSGEGLETIPTVGREFDPELHEAVMKENSGEHPDNTIIEELRPGYTLKGKLIRAAMVKVAG